jgi:hypothetical protein
MADMKKTGLMKHPTVVMGGSGHKAATSFMPTRLALSERLKLYREQGVVWLSPTRGTVHTSVVVSWLSLQWPQNHLRSPLLATEGIEVGDAYNALVRLSMDRKELRNAFGEFGDTVADAPFILSTEEDNVLPSDTPIRLLQAIMTCPDCGEEVNEPKWKCANGHQGYDAVSGLYFIKTDPPTPMAFGEPTFNKKKMNFHQRSVADAVKHQKVLEVNGIAMGCALWRKDLFRRVKATTKNPWFKTTPYFTQDLYFCKRAKLEAHARFGVHCGLRVGHYNPITKELY